MCHEDRDLTIDEILALRKNRDHKLPKVKKVRKPCPRCSGRKVLAQYAHYKNGVCFICKGRGYVLGIELPE